MRADVNGAAIEYDVTGEGRPVVLLHGFPDSGRVWRHQVPALSAAGFQVIVPDLRGYGRSDKPKDVESYALEQMVDDVTGVLDHMGIERAHVVGHDWGAGLAWALASLRPGRVDHLVALSVGHLASYAAAGFEQRVKSWYVLLFQFEGVAERWLSDNDWANFRRMARHPDMEGVIADLESSGSLTPSLNWYRANLPAESWVTPVPAFAPVRVQAPTMGVWGDGDGALVEGQMTGSQAYVDGPWRYERITGAGHWLQLEVPGTVNDLLIDFLPS